MPIALLIIGAALIVTAVRNSYKQLGSQLLTDFSGSGNFIYFVVAIIAVGLLGYIPDFKNPSRALLGLILLVLFIANNGVFTQFVSAVKNAQPSTASPSTEPPAPGPLTVQISGATPGGSSNTLSTATSAASLFGGFL